MANRRLNIVITALDKTKSAFRGISAGVGSVASAVFNLKTALVGVVGAAGIGLLIRNSLQATDALSKTAQKLGVTTESLSALRYAAELSGVGIQTTDMAIQRFTRRLSEAAQGTGEAKGALRELNIDAEALSRLPLEEQMFALADAFGNVKTMHACTMFSNKYFGDFSGVICRMAIPFFVEGILRFIDKHTSQMKKWKKKGAFGSEDNGI